MRLDVDPNELTMGDLEELEELIGHGALVRLFDMFDGGTVNFSSFTFKELNAIVWIMGRKADPTLTLDDVRKAKLVEVGASALPLVPPAAPAGRNGKAGSPRSPGRTRGARRPSSGA